MGYGTGNEFDENGMPVPVYRQPPTHDELRAEILNAFCLPYTGARDPEGDLLPDESQYVGKSKLEVMMHRVSDRAALGDMEAVNFMFDRTIGKPKQHVESVSVTMSYQDFLKEIAQDDSPMAIQADVKIIDGVSVRAQPTLVSKPRADASEWSFLKEVADELDDLADGI